MKATTYFSYKELYVVETSPKSIHQNPYPPSFMKKVKQKRFTDRHAYKPSHFHEFTIIL